MARGSAQNAKGNKANNQPASAKGAGSHLRANKGHEAEFDDFEPLVEPSANRDIAGVVIAVMAIASFIAVISPATAPVTAAVAGFYHLGFGLGAYVLPIVILLFAATLFLGDDSPLNVRSVAGGAVVFVAVVSILSLMVPGTSDSCDLMFTPQNLSASGGYIGAFIASALQNAHNDELLCMQIIEEGVLAIADGSNPRYIQEKLEFMLPASKKRSDKAGG